MSSKFSLRKFIHAFNSVGEFGSHWEVWELRLVNQLGAKLLMVLVTGVLSALLFTAGWLFQVLISTSVFALIDK